MTTLLREPLFHFLVAGGLLFGLTARLHVPPERPRDQTHLSRSSVRAGEASPLAIQVSREDLLAFIQNRTRSEQADEVAGAFNALDEAGRSVWIERFVREEALVREARRLGLDRDDELIRRRLVQQMEFLALGAVARAEEIRRTDLEAYYAAHAEDYRIPAALTFTHVFVKDAGEFDSPSERAQSLVARLAADGVAFREAKSEGDRFLYNRNYVERTFGEIDSHFGRDFAESLLQLPVPGEGEDAKWSGPFRSEHGWHGVLLTRRSDSALPSLGTVEDRLREAILRERREEGLATAVEKIVSGYQVTLDSALEAKSGARGAEAEGGGANGGEMGGGGAAR